MEKVLLDACKERRQAGLQVEGWAKGSVRFVLSGEMERSAAERSPEAEQ